MAARGWNTANVETRHAAEPWIKNRATPRTLSAAAVATTTTTTDCAYQLS